MLSITNKFSIFLLLSLLMFPLLTKAATYSVSPPIIDLELEKRDIVNKQITITNQGDRQVRIYPSVNEVSLDDDGGIQAFVPNSMQEDKSSAVTSWIEVPRKRIEVKPGESVKIPVTFHVNPEVTAGEYHALIGFGDGSNRPQAEAKVHNGTAPAVVVRIGVDKVQNQFLRLQKFTVERFVTGHDESGNIFFELHNPGNDPVVPGGEVIIYDNNGNEVLSLPVNTEGKVVEPEKTTAFTLESPLDLSIGKYKAFLSVEYGEHLTASVHDTAFFYVLPIEQLIAFFMFILVVSVVVTLYVHRRYNRYEDDDNFITDVPLYLRAERSAGKDHDIDLSKKD